MMTYLSVCSGIEAASLAWEPLGFRALGFSEIEPFPAAVLAHRWPGVPNLGDMTLHHDWTDRLSERPDILVGGTPCQAFSVAGLRQGLADPRGNLTLTFLAIAEQLAPRWVVWENVPGVLSDQTGAFGAFLGGLAKLGYGWPYRVLDAQHFGVPQQRRRVFVVGHLGDWRRAAAVLFERHSLSGDTPPRRKTGKGVAGTLAARTGAGGGLGTDFDLDGGLTVAGALCKDSFTGGMGGRTEAAAVGHVLPCHTTGDGFWQEGFGTLWARPQEGHEHVLAFDCKAAGKTGFSIGETAGSLRGEGHGGGHAAVAIQAGALRENPSSGPDGMGAREELAYTIEARSEVQAVAVGVPETAWALQHRDAKGPDSDTKEGHLITVAFSGRSRGDDGRGYDRPPQVFEGGTVGTIDTVKPHCVAFNSYQGTERPVASPVMWGDHRKCENGVRIGYAVRRLTPRECERLQGFPDDHTAIPWRGKPAEQCPDGPRYKAIGNSMAVPVMRWLGERIQHVERVAAELAGGLR